MKKPIKTKPITKKKQTVSKKKKVKSKLPIKKGKKKVDIIRRILILLPLTLCFLWVISLIAKQKLIYLPNIGLKLSPIRDSAPLITGLVIFMCGYMLFLAILYFEDLKDFFKGKKK
ncbi:MAG: hypothetical protein QF506_01430 [Candidatus Woesearchaeota archaeon]|nr:hypothetical protein [Candidatus Woesearchaeota archaeon]